MFRAFSPPRAATSACLVLATTAFTLRIPSLAAQQPDRQSTAQMAPKLKGIWEPVNYPEDVEFTDVFFVTGEIGWAAGLHRSDAGDGGFIIHTRDGGRTWALQLGDPHSATRGFWQLDFIDERHGWATWFGGTLLRTTDGENWEPMGDFAPGNPFVFVSPSVGFHVSGSKIHRTSDGGRTWKEQFDCEATIQVDGLRRSEACSLEALDFASSSVGYAASKTLSNGHSAIVKTEDGGLTWRLASFVPDDSRSGQHLAFLDEQRGYFRGYDNLYATSDGGRSWRAVAATVASGPLQFADAEVGWIILGNDGNTTVSYTTDGGKRWSTRTTAFPTGVVAFSAPRRDRAYVVGTHGMVYRLRAIPFAQPMPARSLPAPLMPAAASQLVAAQGTPVTAAATVTPANPPNELVTKVAEKVKPVDPCCRITAVDLKTGVIRGVEPTNEFKFEFLVSDLATLKSLRVGQMVWADFDTQKVRIHGGDPCCSIVIAKAAPAEPPNELTNRVTPVEPPNDVRPADPPNDLAAKVADKVHPVDPCCGITAVNLETGVITARLGTTARTFQFVVTDPVTLKSLRVGQKVWADFDTQKVRIYGGDPCCGFVPSGIRP